ncbi:hypothetical protein ACFQ21_11985 [Ohtaekwangia kribbensis]|uniref:DUF5658 domain-containing protein n=1 Tax=Ohtaekwangia kribbensis TaxID=688913 RepID=A0ABW3K4X2_9BACT
MENDLVDNLISGLISRADRLSLLYLSAAALALLVARLKFQDENGRFEYKGVSFKITQYWIVAIAFTIVHIYFAYLFVNACDKFEPFEDSVKRKAFAMLTYSDAPFIFQDMSLVKPTGIENAYTLDFMSPAVILLLGILTLIVLTIIKIKNVNWQQKIFYWLIAYVIMVANFYTGGWWMIELSKSLAIKGGHI